MAKNSISASQKYWEKRRALEDQYRLIQERATLKKLTDDILPDALKEIQKQLTAQADLHNITMAELLADYSNRDQKKYREYVEKNYNKLMNSNEKYQEFIDEFFPDYDYAKVNRLLQIRTDIFDVFAREMIKKDENKVFNDRLEDILQRTYTSNSKALARILSVDVPNKLSRSELDNILNYPWSGKTFSNRLWGNVSKLEQNLSAAIVKSISSGQGVVEALRTMSRDSEICDMFKLESSKFKKAIDNLVRTEYASFAQQGIAKSYEATDVEEYDVLTSEDEKVCSVCGGVEKGNPYKLKDAIIGVNRGPFHGRCRCTDIPHIPDLPASIDKEYEAMFGDLLDEFAKDQFGVTLTHPKSAAARKREYNEGNDRTRNYQRAARLLEDNEAIRQRAKAEIELEGQYNDMYDRYMEIRKSGKYDETLRVQTQTKYRELVKLQEDNARLNASAVKEILGQHRQMGIGDLDLSTHFTKPRSKYAKFMKEVYDHYPTDWIKKSIEYGQLDVGKAKRGYYWHAKNGPSELRLSGRSGKSNQFRTALHEMAHRQEHINEALLSAEKAFYEMRTKDEKLKRLRDIFPGTGYKTSEVTRVDNFNDPYMGKDYDGRAYELMSMGLDTLYTRPLDLINDKEMFEWVIEMILTT